MKLMNIGVIGYYGFGNAGDDVIFENMRHIVAPHRAIPLPVGLLNGPDTVRRLNAFDFLILGGGGLFRDVPPSPFGAFDKWGSALQTPIGVLGVGVTTLDGRYEEATQKLVERSAFFVVRDEDSRRLIGHPKVQVAADLTFYRPFRPVTDGTMTDSGIIGVNLRPAHTGVDDWTNAVCALAGPRRTIPLSAHPALGDRDALLALDPDCPKQFSINMYAGLDVLIGTAFHSLVFAIQTATPVVAINYDPKVYRLMHEAGLGDYLLEWDAWNDLAGCVERARADRGMICRRMLEYTAQAERSLHDALEFPKQLIDDYATRLEDTAAPKRTSTVSTLVNGVGAAATDITRTLASCRAQTHSAIEILLVTDRHEPRPHQSTVVDSSQVREIHLDGTHADWVTAGLAEATGTYVSWLDAGAWYTDDAIALLVDTLETAPNAVVAHSCYFLTRDGIIERKVTLDNVQIPGRAVQLGPGILVRRHKAHAMWTQIKSGSQAAGVGEKQTRYVKSALFFQPATVAESRLYHSLVAYSRGDFPRGKQTLQTLRSEGSREWVHQHDVIKLITAVAGNAPIARNPLEFVELFFDNLPEGFDDISHLERQVLSQLLMRQFYATSIGPGTAINALRTAMRAVRYDPEWLRNRGVWVRGLRALRSTFGDITRSVYRSIAPSARNTDHI